MGRLLGAFWNPRQQDRRTGRGSGGRSWHRSSAGADAPSASSDAVRRVARASQLGRRTMRWTSGCSRPCGSGRVDCKKMARSRFTDILNAFISEGDRRGGHLGSWEGFDWLRAGWQLVGWSGQPACAAPSASNRSCAVTCEPSN